MDYIESRPMSNQLSSDSEKTKDRLSANFDLSTA